MVRSRMLGIAAVVAAGLATGTAANAAPFGYAPPDSTVLIERVAGGCGPGFHPNPWGHCRPNDRGWGYGGRPGYGYGHGGGYERGPGGYDGPRRFYGGW
ncbi:GCG_CRPN prefix-to-repeats domain-containing protein [Methylobacterium mesophilicum]